MNTEPRPEVHEAAIEDDEYIPSLRDNLGVIGRRLWVIVLVAIVFVGMSVGLSLVRTPQYEASIEILVGQQRDADLSSNVQGLQKLTPTLASAVEKRPLAEAVIQEMTLPMTPEDFLENINVEQDQDTQFIRVSYKDPSPERARDVADVVGNEFTEQISEISPDVYGVTATVWESAVVPEYPISPKPMRDGVLGLVAGIFVGVGLAFLLEHLDDSWRSPELQVPKTPSGDKKKVKG
jgi:receptor protein-tyrosine kinase